MDQRRQPEQGGETGIMNKIKEGRKFINFRVPKIPMKMESQFEDGEQKDEMTSVFKEERLKGRGNREEKGYESTQGSSQNRILLPQPKDSFV